MARGVLQISRLTFASIGVGLAFSLGLYLFLFLQKNKPELEISATVAMTWLCFWVTEASGIEGSGILATVTFALTFGLYGVHRVSPEVVHSMHATWQSITFFANTLLFVISGVIVLTKIREDFGEPKQWGAVFAIYGIVHAARAITLLISFPILRRSVYGFNIQQCIIVWWGGLRGAIGLALGLIVVDDTGFSESVRGEVMFLMSSLVLLTLLINAPTTEWLYVALGLNDVSPCRTLVLQQVVEDLQADDATRRRRLCAIPFLSNARYRHRYDWIEGARKILLHQPSLVAGFFHRITPSRVRVKPSDWDSPRREIWATMLRVVLHLYHELFHEGLVEPHPYGLLDDGAQTALDQNTDLEDALQVEWWCLQRHLDHLWAEKVRGVPGLNRLYARQVSQKGYSIMQCFPIFVRAHCKAIDIVKNTVMLPEVPEVAARMEANLRSISEEMKGVWWETFSKSRRLYEHVRDFYYTNISLTASLKEVNELAANGLIDHSDLVALQEHINHKKATLNEKFAIKMLEIPDDDPSDLPTSEMPFLGVDLHPSLQLLNILANARKENQERRKAEGSRRQAMHGAWYSPHDGYGNGMAPYYYSSAPLALMPTSGNGGIMPPTTSPGSVPLMPLPISPLGSVPLTPLGSVPLTPLDSVPLTPLGSVPGPQMPATQFASPAWGSPGVFSPFF